MFSLVVGLAFIALAGDVYAKASTDEVSVSTSNRVVGGQNADIRDHPHMLLLRRDGLAHGGAVVIGSRYALTAAHCVYPLPDPQTITLHGGSTNQTGMSATFHVYSVLIHPNYDDAKTNNDVAILGVSNLFSEYPNVAPIALENIDPVISTTSPTDCYVTGWGLLNRQTRTVPNTLQIGYLRLVAPRTCRLQWFPYTITTSMICAQGTSVDACAGDSGGPLVCNDRLYGVVSWGSTSCDGSRAAVFAKIPALTIRSFIRANIGL